MKYLAQINFLIILLYSSCLSSQNLIEKDTLIANDTISSEKKSILLNEIQLNYFDASKLNLGIDFKNMKRYTPAERRYNEASSGPIGFINLVNGKLKTLKKNIIIEKQQFAIDKLEILFDSDFYLNKAKIPTIYIKGFIYYVVGFDEFVAILNSAPKDRIQFELLLYAERFNSLKKE